MNIKRILFFVLLIVLFSFCFTFAETGHTNVTNVNLKQHQITLKEGRKAGLEVTYTYMGPQGKTDVKWSSSNTYVATVKNGRVQANHKGKTRVKVDIEGEEDYCDIIVQADKPCYLNTKQCYSELNKYRKKAHRKSLKKDAKLEKLAKIRVKEMAEKGKFSHTRPNGKSSLTLIKGNKHKGENIAKGQISCVSVTQAWYGSKGHRENMLRKQFTKVGIAAYRYKGIIYWCQMYSS